MLSLNEDCLAYLLEFVNPVERYCLKRTCKTFYTALTDQRTWKSFTEQACLIDAKLVDYFAYHPGLLTPRCFANALRSNQLELFLDLEKRVTRECWECSQHSVSFVNYAAASGNIKLFKFIYRHYYQKRTEQAAEYAIKYGHLSMLSHLEQQGFLQSPKNLFCLAIQAGRLRIMNWLRKKYYIPPSGHYYGYVTDSCKFCKCKEHAQNLFAYLEKMGCVFAPIGVLTACQRGNFYAFQTILKNCPSARLVFSAAIGGGNLQIIEYFLEKGFLPKEEDILQCATWESFVLLLNYFPNSLHSFRALHSSPTPHFAFPNSLHSFRALHSSPTPHFAFPKEDHEELCKKIAQKALRDENIHLYPVLVSQKAELLLYACSLRQPRTIEILLSMGHKLEQDCLFMACYYGNLKLVRFLLAQGLCLHQKLPYYALYGRQTEIFNLLIELGLSSPGVEEMANPIPLEQLLLRIGNREKITPKKFALPTRHLVQIYFLIIVFLFWLEIITQ